MDDKYKLFEYQPGSFFSSLILVEILKHPYLKEIYPLDITRLSEKDSSIHLASIFYNILNHNKSSLTFLNEFEYIDRDYLEDYTEFYARSFNSPRKTCSRVHIFKDITEDKVADILNGNDVSSIKELKSAYLGFIIVRPLIHTIYGKCCLPNHSKNSTDKFIDGCDFKVNLFGIKLEVNGVPFIEQDLATSACGTMSIWMSFHSISKLFGNFCPSPSKITRTAVTELPAENQNKFSSELTASQLKKAVESSGLKYVEFQLNGDTNLLKAIVKAYCNIGIAPILLAKIKLRGKYSHKTQDGKKLIEVVERDLEYHAVTIHGYRNYKYLSDHPERENNLILDSDKIKTLVIHDDQGGPFVELNTKNNDRLIKVHGRKIASPLQDATTYFEVSSVIVPLYHKIRLSYLALEKFVSVFQKDFSTYLSKNDTATWKIVLTTASKLKQSIRQKKINTDVKNEIVFSNLPKYIWEVTCKESDKELITIIFDATNHGSGQSVLYVFNEDEPLLTAYYILFCDWATYLFSNISARNGYSSNYILAMQNLSKPDKYWSNHPPINLSIFDLRMYFDENYVDKLMLKYSACVGTSNEVLTQELQYLNYSQQVIAEIQTKVKAVNYQWIVVVGYTIKPDVFPGIIISYDMRLDITKQKAKFIYVDDALQDVLKQSNLII